MRSAIRRAAKIGFGLAGAAFLVVAFLATWDRSQGVPLPAPWALVASFVLMVVSLSAGYRAWAVLLGALRDRRLAVGFFTAQLGKYVPGAVWQVVGQVGYATAPDRSLPRVATAFAVFALTQAASGALVGAAVLVAAPAPPGPVRFLGLLILPLALLLDRRWMVRAVAAWRRRRRDASDEAVVPAQRIILRAFVWNAACLALTGLAFAVLFAGITGTLPLSAIPAFSMAWTVGFLALPFPSGLGVREAVLVALLAGVSGASPLIAASIYLRLVMMAAEVALIGLSRARVAAATAVSRGGSRGRSDRPAGRG